MSTRHKAWLTGHGLQGGLIFSLILLLIGVATLPVSRASAHDSDYYPGDVWMDSLYGIQVGPNGTYLENNSVTYLDISEVAGHYNVATGFSRILTGGSANCGVYDGCVYYDVQGTSLDWNSSCTVPTVAPGYWAETRVQTGSFNNTGCNIGGSNYAPIWLIPINTTSVGSGWYYNQHVGRHELGHALTLDDASHSCWSESGYYYPLMNNGPCTNAYNAYLTPHEISTLVSRNGWY